MSNFVSLEDAAKKLGVSVEELVEMRSRGEIFGYRDGGSWKFKPEEIERVASEMLGDALDEDPAGSSILVSESELGSGSKHGSTIGSDVVSEDGGSDLDSDVSLVPDPGSGSDVRLVASSDASKDDSSDIDLVDSGDELKFVDSADELQLPDSDDDDDELSLASDEDDILADATGSKAGSGVSSDLELSGSDLQLAGSELDLAGSGPLSDISASGTGIGADSDADVKIDSDLELAGEPSGLSNSGVLSDSDADLSLEGSGLVHGDSDASIGGSDLELTDDGDLVLGGSDLALGTDSGINLMSPADSGISLEDEPLDLAASGISGLDLAMEGSGSDIAGASASGSAVDFQQDEEFQLSPSGALEADDDSGSQVIELEDSSEFGEAAVALPAEEGFDAFADVDGGGGLDEPEAADAFGAAAPAGAAVAASPEVPYSVFQVVALLGILMLMCLSGILVTDVVRNMWAWSGTDANLTSGFTAMVLNVLGY